VSNQDQGYLFVYLGTSKSGRVDVAKKVGEKLGLTKIVKYATRGHKPGDVAGVSQHFISEQEFHERRAAGDFLDVTQNDKGDFYGVTRDQIDTALADGRSAYLTIPNPMDALPSIYKGRMVRIFVFSSRDEYQDLLTQTGSSEQEVSQKLAHYDKKMQFKDGCDLIFENDNLEATISRAEAALAAYINP